MNTKCMHALKGTELPHASPFGGIALSTTLAAAPIVLPHATVTFVTLACFNNRMQYTTTSHMFHAQ